MNAAQNPTMPNATIAASGTYSLTVTVAGCTSAAATTIATVNPTPITPTVTSNAPICEGSDLLLNASSAPGSTYAWTGPNGFTSAVQNPTITAATLAATGTYIVTAMLGTCTNTASIAVTVKPVPVITATKTDPTACGSSTGSIIISGLVTGNSYTVSYVKNSGSPSVVNNVIAVAPGQITISNLSSGTYSNIFVTLNGCTSNIAGPVTLSDPNPPATPTATGNAPICSGVNLMLNATTSASGVATYSWTGPNGFTSNLQSPIINNATVINAGNYFVTVTVNNCVSLPATLPVVIYPLPAAPGAATPITYCIGINATALTASTSNVGNTLNWYTVPTGGVASPNAPVPFTVTAGTTNYYVSQSSQFDCEGPRAQIQVKVNPDARAVFIPTDTIKCSPFQITSSVIGLQQFPLNNSNYLWYANNVLIGSGTTFPGYTINSQNDSVIIKLVAISLYGCKNDSTSRKFKTYKLPAPSFTKNPTQGCGPLVVQFTNTTPDASDYTYSWNFGNGQTSTLQQPGPITFQSAPSFNDTFYIVKLKVFSICGTLTFTDSVLVKSKPKALFSPNNVNGCSPMHVNFTNTSQGLGNTYFWDFDDGQTFTTTSTAVFQHIFYTGVIDTFHVKLKATNSCGSDSITYLIIAAPNTIVLNFSFNGTSQYGCAPHSMAFYNNSTGGGSFLWNFGDGTTVTTVNNTDTVPHTYNLPGVYTVTVTATNNCSDTSSTNTITVYPKPTPAFTANNYTLCVGQQVAFNNTSTGATSQQWQFGDGTFSAVINPVHTYATPGLYTVKLIVYNSNPSGNVCRDSLLRVIQVTASQPGNISISANSAPCAPHTVTFTNLNVPSVNTTWDFGDGQTGTGNIVTHTYTAGGVFNVHVISTAPGGCISVTDSTITIGGPAGSFTYNSGYVCYPAPAFFQANATNTNTYLWNFGDGNSQTTSASSVFHQYANPGLYVPTLSLQSTPGCNLLIPGIDTIKVDKIVGGFTTGLTSNCGSTTVAFSDTSHAFFGKALVKWDFGDSQTGIGFSPNHVYTATGIYQIEMIVIGNSGCTDTIRRPLNIFVKSKPTALITGPTIKCGLENVTFTANINSTDPVIIRNWLLSNGATATGNTFVYNFTNPGTYTVRLIAGTSFGCFDTTFHTILVKPVPVVTASGDVTLCVGNSANLSVSGASSYQWTPIQGLSCNTCTNPVANPIITTPYVVAGTTNGCTATDTVIVTVIQPLQITHSPNDSICIGESVLLQASGAASYLWNPASTLSDATIRNPLASPTSTTIYRVIGYDGKNCFTDTAFITVAVGLYPIVSLGPDRTLAAGTQYSFLPVIQNGPIRNWLWNPAVNLSCSNCLAPVANIKKDISYTVKVTTPYGCSAYDTINIKVFCLDTQVFIPNAFTPDGDGVNDVLMVRGSGIVTVKHFRIFNRWGEVVFERNNFSPNNPVDGWDGRFKGKYATPDVFVYTAEVMCENGNTFIYKGNISIIK